MRLLVLLRQLPVVLVVVLFALRTSFVCCLCRYTILGFKHTNEERKEGRVVDRSALLHGGINYICLRYSYFDSYYMQDVLLLFLFLLTVSVAYGLCLSSCLLYSPFLLIILEPICELLTYVLLLLSISLVALEPGNLSLELLD